MTKIPKKAKRVFTGILFDVHQWQQELFDGSTTTFEAIRRIPTVQIIATTTDDKIVLLREEQPYVGSFTSVPGGRVERGSTPEETVKQELLEELGMEAGELDLWQKHAFSSTIVWESYDYIARKCSRLGKPRLEPGERIEPYLVTLDQLLVEVEKPSFRNKRLADKLFRIRHTPGDLDKLRERLFPTGD